MPKRRGDNHRKGGFLKNRIFFVLIYLTVIGPTYVLPYFGSNSGILNLAGEAVGVGALPQFWMHVTALYLAVIVAWFRGIYVGKSWVAIFPFLAALFDMLPGFNWVFLIPTVFHVITLVMGVRGENVEAARISTWQFRGAAGFSLVFLTLIVIQFINYEKETFGRNSLSIQSTPSSTTVARPVAPQTLPQNARAKAGATGNASSSVRPHSQQIPVAPEKLVQISECLLYKCFGEPMLPDSLLVSLDVFQLPDINSARLGSLKKGVKFIPLNAAWVTLRPGKYKVTTVTAETEHEFKPGDVIYTYAYWGEGCYTAWFKGTLYGYFDERQKPPKNEIACIFFPGNVEPLQTVIYEFWFQAKLENGNTGWVKGLPRQ